MEQISLPTGWDSWQICRELGEGTYGTVYLAEKRINDNLSQSAVKIIRISPGENDAFSLSLELGSKESVYRYYEDLAQSYIQEIRMMIALKGHPNIVYIEDYAVEEEPDIPQWTIYIRMECLTPLAEYIQTHPFQEKDVILMGTDLCSALIACGQKGIVHRDIKPSNIFVSPMGQFKLGDFGVARKLDRTSGLYSAKGTFPYMAPEVFHSKPYDQRSDVYSLGLVLYHLLNKNREPFVDLNKQIVYMKDRESATARRMGGEPLPSPADASPALAKVILKACDPDPEKRYPDAESFRQALQAASTGSKGHPQNPNRSLYRIVTFALLIFLTAILILSQHNKDSIPESKETSIPADIRNTVDPSVQADTESALDGLKRIDEQIMIAARNSDAETVCNMLVAGGYTEQMASDAFDDLHRASFMTNRFAHIIVETDVLCFGEVVHYSGNDYYSYSVYLRKENGAWQLSVLTYEEANFFNQEEQKFYNPEAVKAYLAGRNMTAFGNKMWMDKYGVMQDVFTVNAAYMYQKENGDVGLVICFANGGKRSRTVNSFTVTVSDDSLGEVLAVKKECSITVPSGLTELYEITIDANEVTSGTWTKIQCNCKYTWK